MAAPLNAPLPPGGADIDVSAPVNILLVDDQPARLLSYRAILEPLGERLVEATSGTEALQRLMDEEFALILLDVNMPGMDGFETASVIHQHPRFERTPIIFVTAVNVTDMDRLRGYKLGAVDYVMVPIIPEILRGKVLVLAELFRKRRELQLANRALHAAQARELESLNDSLRQANAELAARNGELRKEIGERTLAEERLRETDRRKDEFLATLAHELRNPLAPMLNALNIRRLREPDTDDPLQVLMERQMALLVRLIDDLLDVARITRGKLVLRREATTLDDVLRSAIETATPLIERGRHSLRLQMPPEAVPLNADPARLSQVFANLLNNAAKYSDPGSEIVLSARCTGNDSVEIQVRDHGIGLSAEQQRRVFELFAQADNAIERAYGGLGIGLTLVRRLVEMHGGEVAVHSDGLGHGSAFRVRLPRQSALAAAQPAAPSAEVRAVPRARGHRALVVDDNRDAADTLAMMLELMGLDVRRLYEPHSVEAEFADFAPDVVFLDVGMPGRNGYDVASGLRAMPAGADVLLVAVTGWGQPQDRQRTHDAGFDDHLVKPAEFEAIRGICLRIASAARDAPA